MRKEKVELLCRKHARDKIAEERHSNLVDNGVRLAEILGSDVMTKPRGRVCTAEAPVPVGIRT